MSKQNRSGFPILRPLALLILLISGLLYFTQIFNEPSQVEEPKNQSRVDLREALSQIKLVLLSSGSFQNHSSSVSKVIDGDTVRLKDQTEVRYLGIDTPEKASPFYREASQKNRQLVEDKSVVILSPKHKSRDSYGRLIGVTFVSPESKPPADLVCVPFRLLSSGLAHIYIKDSNPLLSSLLPAYQQAQNYAIQQNLGIWKTFRLNSKNDFIATRFRFHKKDCRHMQGRKKIQWISSLTAFKSGRSPCRTCRPALHP